jgi:hypothetical protein
MSARGLFRRSCWRRLQLYPLSAAFNRHTRVVEGWDWLRWRWAVCWERYVRVRVAFCAHATARASYYWCFKCILACYDDCTSSRSRRWGHSACVDGHRRYRYTVDQRIRKRMLIMTTALCISVACYGDGRGIDVEAWPDRGATSLSLIMRMIQHKCRSGRRRQSAELKAASKVVDCRASRIESRPNQ